MSGAITILTHAVREFAEARDWGQFHTPKNVTMALVVEAAELMELYQWLRPDEGANRQRVREEMADVLIYLLRLSDLLQVNLMEAVRDKLHANALKYPVATSKGRASASVD